jgi:hypothetical protein
MFPSIVETERYGIVTVKALDHSVGHAHLATSGMIGRQQDAGRNPPAGFLRQNRTFCTRALSESHAIVTHAESAI